MLSASNGQQPKRSATSGQHLRVSAQCPAPKRSAPSTPTWHGTAAWFGKAWHGEGPGNTGPFFLSPLGPRCRRRRDSTRRRARESRPCRSTVIRTSSRRSSRGRVRVTPARTRPAARASSARAARSALTSPARLPRAGGELPGSPPGRFTRRSSPFPRDGCGNPGEARQSASSASRRRSRADFSLDRVGHVTRPSPAAPRE